MARPFDYEVVSVHSEVFAGTHSAVGSFTKAGMDGVENTNVH